ncbi:MAG: cytochrome b [Hyphomicrobiaceae bacterium]
MIANQSTYDRMSVVLHWVVGLGIILLAGTELLRHEFPKGHFIREGLKSIHQPLGTILFGLILVRVTWRLMLAKVPGGAQGGRLAGLAASAVHVLLYAVMIALPLAGLVYVFGSDKSVDFFGLYTLAVPLKAVFGGVAKSAREIHEALGVGILLLAGVHAVAALGHHYLLKDGVLARMSFRSGRDRAAV